MIAPDTNVLVRIITNDDASQASVAADVLRSNTVFLCKTVIMELEWVLRYSYDFDRETVGKALATLIGLRNSVIEDAAVVERAVEWYEEGMDLADALHLSSSNTVNTFVTFDRKMAIAASKQGISPTVQLLTDTEQH
ncbi:MAG: type II toxin-antitoxin system VapC family toxin [Acidobacteria bacterium]|nr:MAG: type II toxin-antitoxin system VapC family toxin [Acidobacteriota bacterium]RLE30822.1 MAG: type II toxin-antitoxin system VapC family toxin [Acidobacteriota bacterium]